jgi:cobalt-zinc-cadmium efflux system membrane fusion protein
MNKFKWLYIVPCLAIFTACTHKDDHSHDAPKAKAPAKSAAAEQGHGHGGGNAITHYTESSELFVEFPHLVKGEEAAFAAHLSRLADFKAISEGKLTVTLSGGGQTEERTEIGVSKTPGIFRPVLKPQHTGKRRLTFQLVAAGITSTHDLGEVDVFSDRKAADTAAKPEGGDEGIKFTKEQQWKIDFANTPAIEREVRESIAVTATLRPRTSGEAQIAVPSAGLLRAGPSGFPQVGMKIAAGQIVAYLAPRLGGETDVATLNLAIQRARIESAQATQERERLEGLLAVEAIAAKRVVEARHRERLVQAELSAAEQRAATYQGGTGGIALKSPIAGTVVAVNGSPGAAVTDGQMIVHVAVLDKLWLDARVPESDLGRITSPTGAFFRLDGTQNTTVLEVGRNARLIAFGGMVDKESRTVPAIIEFDNADALLRAGMQIQARLYTGRAAKGIAIPASALLDDAGQTVVFVQKEGESFERRTVEAGPRDGDWIAIKSGIAAGERVVTKGAYQVRLAATQPAAMGHGHAH